MDTLAYIAAAMRLDVRLHSVAWTISILLYELNLLHIRTCNITCVQYLILLGMLGVTASVGPSMIIWVSIAILATTNSQC
eukprot:3491366-Rhodomonas_salina.1